MDSFAGKRLVVFGCGYVGTAVALDALARGARVTALTRNAATARDLSAQGIETVVADLADEAWHERVLGGPDFVLNCVSAGGGGLEGYRRSYFDGMRSVLSWAEKTRPTGTLIYTSSTSVYPQGGGVVVEENAPNPENEASERAKVLLQTEALLRNSRGACGRWFVLRLAGIYGPGRHQLVDQVRGGEVSGTGDRHLNLVHRDDIVGAIRTCFAAAPALQNEVFNVVDDSPKLKADVVEWLAAELGVPIPRFTGEPVSAQRAMTPDRIISNAKLKARLAWVPRYPSFREGYGCCGLRPG